MRTERDSFKFKHKYTGFRTRLLLLVIAAGALLALSQWAARTSSRAEFYKQRQLLHAEAPVEGIQCPWGPIDAHSSAWRPVLLPEPGKPRTELLSFPGSGNSWVRHLIEISTGYRTNSIYHCNVQNYPSKIAADCNKWNASIVTKSHVLNCKANWDKAIILVRNPLHAIRAEFQRAHTWNQTAVVSQQEWSWSDWYSAVEKKCTKWARDHEVLLGRANTSDGRITGCPAKHNRTVHVFFYEDLKTPAGELNPVFLDQLLTILGIQGHNAYKNCAMKLSDGKFRRLYPTDTNHPAVQVLTDARTLDIVNGAGCMHTYNMYKAAFSQTQASVSY